MIIWKRYESCKFCFVEINQRQGREMKSLRKTYLAALAVLLSPMAANADVIGYDITVSGNWFDTNGTPYGMPLSSVLNGSIIVDNSLTGIAALVSFSLTTGAKVWTEAEFVGSIVADLVFDSFGELTQFSLNAFEDGSVGSMYIYSNNTFAVNENSERSLSNACNSCVSFSRAASVPEPGTLALLGLGLAGIGFAKRKKA